MQESLGRESDPRADLEEHNRALYLDLMKRAVLNYIYGHVEQKPLATSPGIAARWIGKFFERLGIRISRHRPFDPEKRAIGRGWPPTAHSMIGLKRLENVEFCVRDVIESGVPGDLIETGVWRGGATIFMRAVLRSYDVRDRTVWVADSFQGIPGDKQYKAWRLRIPLEDVQANFRGYGLLDDRVRFLKGWFKDTLPEAPIDRLAVLRLDGDLYESTMDALVHLYPKLSVGGYLIVDDYGSIAQCRQAVHDYFDEHGISEKLEPIDHTGVYCKRTA